MKKHSHITIKNGLSINRPRPISNGVQKTIERGIDFLAKGQEKDGSFFCLVSTKFDDYRNADKVPAIVPTNIVLSSLINIFGSVATERIKQKAAKFLIGEKSDYWSFNYWFRDSLESKSTPYPDDLDDTFCALAALYEYKPDLFDGEAMAKIAIVLTSAEEDEGGPYDMWILPPDKEIKAKWKKIDLAVNSNIGYFLSLHDISLPKLGAFIEKSIDNKNYIFPYCGIYPAIYFISRFYRGQKTKKIIDTLIKNQEKDGKWENPLRTALAISSLINLESFKHREHLARGIEYLIKTQNKDGGWNPYSFYIAKKTKDYTLYDGAASITTALCLEAINKFQKSQITKSKSQINSQFPIPNFQKKIYDKVIKNFQQRFSGFSKDFRDKAAAIADKISTKNRDIALLPFYFRDALGPEPEQARYGAGAKGAKIEDDFIVRLGLANLFGWVAYTIYDDFLDEGGDPKKLSLANVCLRESAEIFGAALPASTGFPSFSKKIFDAIDNANMWEVNHARDLSVIPTYGDFSQLADKSLGHALGPAAILFALGYRENSKELKSLMRFFKNYIIARQLNDDAHDWEDDLKRGQVNAVSARLLKDVYSVVNAKRSTTGAKGKAPKESKHPKGQAKNLEKLRVPYEAADTSRVLLRTGREIFWHKTVVGVCKDISRHTELAKNNLKKLSIIKDREIFAGMLAPIEQSAEKTLKERKETIKFLKTYKPR